MRFVIFGLTISSAWANGHATPLRALLKALYRQGHATTFFERDVDYYAHQRDLPTPEYCTLVLYRDWADVRGQARRAIQNSDVALVTSYCPDGLAAAQLVLDVPGPLHAFYDMDTPVTLAALERDGVAVPSGAHYLVPRLIPEFDVYFSFTGGPVLEHIERRWGARRAEALYGSVDPEIHAPMPDAPGDFACSLGYLGTYAADRQAALERLLLEPARRLPAARMLAVGSLYPDEIQWPANVRRLDHLEPRLHPTFYTANRITLSITRQAMREWGYTPSGRLFEATACGTPVMTDAFSGLAQFFSPGEEILVADTTEAALANLALTDAELERIGAAGRERTLAQHTGEARARQLVESCQRVLQPC